MRFPLLLAAVLLTAACKPQPAPAPDADAASAPLPEAATGVASDTDLLARGEYLVRIGGCNDCHTPGYADAAGEMPTARWLVGSPLGWHGPWGTTYPANLRLKVQEMDEAGWMEYSGKLHTRPPMPDFALRGMQEQDRRAIYRFVKSLGPAGQPAPAYLPPGDQPPVPYVDFVLPPPPADAPPASG